jgi:hypothetical protein
MSYPHYREACPTRGRLTFCWNSKSHSDTATKAKNRKKATLSSISRMLRLWIIKPPVVAGAASRHRA